MPSVVLGKARREEGGEGGSAVPCSGYAHRKSFVLLGKPAGAQREGYAEAAMPRRTPMARTSWKVFTNKYPYINEITIADISTMAAFFRPMYWERTPNGKRMRAPASVGIETIKPIWAGVRWNCSEMKGPIAPLSTQTAKEKSK
jgi:hypothetical protein